MKKIISLLLATILVVGCASTVFAQDTEQSMQPYEEKLDELNRELGTDLAIVPGDGTEQEMVDFYTNMTIEEFEEYVKDAYEKAQEIESASVSYSSAVESGIQPYANVAYLQRLYYNVGDTSNYLYVRAYVNSETGLYTGVVYDLGSKQVSYPSYKCNSASYSFSSNKKQITCKYNVTKYLTSTLIQTTVNTITCTFTANGGNLYASGAA